MPDSIMYQEDGFVVLETGQTEKILTPQELLEKLKAMLSTRQNDLPKELSKLTSVEEQAEYLRDNFCEFDIGNDGYLQWYVIRFNK